MITLITGDCWNTMLSFEVDLQVLLTPLNHFWAQRTAILDPFMLNTDVSLPRTLAPRHEITMCANPERSGLDWINLTLLMLLDRHDVVY